MVAAKAAWGRRKKSIKLTTKWMEDCTLKDSMGMDESCSKLWYI
jgi:hypothetical protein